MRLQLVNGGEFYLTSRLFLSSVHKEQRTSLCERGVSLILEIRIFDDMNAKNLWDMYNGEWRCYLRRGIIVVR